MKCLGLLAEVLIMLGQMVNKQPLPQGLLQNGESSKKDLPPTICHFENHRGEGPGDETG